MGGVLNAILPEKSEPVDISDRLKTMGIFAQNNLEQLVRRLEPLSSL